MLITITVAHIKSLYDATAMLTHATLQDLANTVREKNTVVLNCLDLPLGGQTVDFPPMFTDLVTETYALPFVKSLVVAKDLSHNLSWGTASTKNAILWLHTDDEGFATSISVKAGAKLWILADSTKSVDDSDEMANIHVYGKTLGVNDFTEEEWSHEAILLKPGCVLYVLRCFF